MPVPCLNKTNVELRKRLSRLNKTNVEVEKRMSRLNKRNTEIEKRRSNVKTTNKLNFDRKNAPYTFDLWTCSLLRYYLLSDSLTALL